jgi:hypothetical protein
MVSRWVFEENLRPVLEILARSAGYNFDERDWTAVRYGVQATDYEGEHWYDYEFVGVHRVALGVARDEGSCVIFIRCESDAEIERTADVVLTIAQEFRLSRGS